MSMKNRSIIVFYGIDGSGKSTLALSLARLLSKYSYRVKIVKLRGHHTIVYILVRFILWIRGVNYRSLQGKPLYLNYIITRHFKNKRLYITLEIIGVLLWFILRLIPILILHRNNKSLIIADRYIPDFVTTLAFTSGIKDQTMVRIAWFLERFQRLKPIYFFIYVDPDQALMRKKDEHLTKSFCTFMDSKYKRLSKHLNSVIFIDASNQIEDIIPIIFRELQKNCNLLMRRNSKI